LSPGHGDEAGLADHDQMAKAASLLIEIGDLPVDGVLVAGIDAATGHRHPLK
jgi:hypothetical protein